MALNDTELRYYDSNVLRLPADKRSEYHQQVNRLITTTEVTNPARNEWPVSIHAPAKGRLGAFGALERNPLRLCHSRMRRRSFRILRV